MSNTLALSLTPSFAEAAIADSANAVQSKRFYLPKQGFTHIQKWLTENSLKADRVVVCSRFLEKILQARMGGSVAQVVTKGFANWLEQKQPVSESYFSTTPHGNDSLGAHELIFEVQERTDANGIILQDLQLEDLQSIASQLKEKNISKICLQFLFSGKNPQNLLKAKTFFQESAMEVFCSETQDNFDETNTWRKPLLAACLSGSLQELQEELAKSFELEKSQVHFYEGPAKGPSSDAQLRLNHLHSWVDLWDQKYPQNLVLHLGLENWNFLRPKDLSSDWTSPWGRIGGFARGLVKSAIQPSLEIVNTSQEGIRVGYMEKGFEPGPCSLGRSFHLTLFDLMALTEKLNPLGTNELQLKRAQELLLTMCKSHPRWRNQTAQKISESLLEICAQQLWMECQLYGQDKAVTLAGFYAPLFEPILKKLALNRSLQLDLASESHLLLQGKHACP